MSAARSKPLRLLATDGQDMSLVDGDNQPVASRELMTDDEKRELGQLRTNEDADRAADAVANLTLNPLNLKRAAQLRATFDRAEEGSDAAECLLLELVAGDGRRASTS